MTAQLKGILLLHSIIIFRIICNHPHSKLNTMGQTKKGEQNARDPEKRDKYITKHVQQAPLIVHSRENPSISNTQTW